jgi:polysaccharide pyruvyl transferase WcaK-like protein
MAAKKIGLYGFYKHGNFGDDVMCIMIARTLKSLGFRPIVYQLPAFYAIPEQVDTADTLESLLDGAAACVLGGGGLLISAGENVFPALLEMDQDLERLATVCQSRSIPVWGVSIGGTGTGRFSKLYPGLARLLGSGTVRGMTLRLVQDAPLLDVFNIPSAHYSDIVFLAPDFWPARQSTPARNMIVTHQIARAPFGRRLVQFLDMFGPSLCGLTPRHLGLTHVGTGRDAATALVGRRDRQVPYNDIQEFADLLSASRCILSSKLHLGILGMSYGAVFFSYYGKEKTRAQLRELGLHSQILSRRNLPSWLARLRTGCSEEVEATSRMIEDLRTNARGHFTALASFLQSV